MVWNEMESLLDFRYFTLRNPLLLNMNNAVPTASNFNEFDTDDIPQLDHNIVLVPITDPISHQISYISAEEAIRLYKSIHAPPKEDVELDDDDDEELPSVSDDDDVGSNKPTCRICRCDSDTALIECPCKCKGTVGYVHERCLRKWKQIRRIDYCEICKEPYTLEEDTRTFRQLITSFFQRKYFGAFITNIVNLFAITPLAYFNINQLVDLIDSIEDGDVKQNIYLPILIFVTGIFFFMYFEWALQTILRLDNIIRHWWHNTIPDDDIDELFFDDDFFAF